MLLSKALKTTARSLMNNCQITEIQMRLYNGQQTFYGIRVQIQMPPGRSMRYQALVTHPEFNTILEVSKLGDPKTRLEFCWDIAVWIVEHKL